MFYLLIMKFYSNFMRNCLKEGFVHFIMVCMVVSLISDKYYFWPDYRPSHAVSGPSWYSVVK